MHVGFYEEKKLSFLFSFFFLTLSRHVLVRGQLSFRPSPQRRYDKNERASYISHRVHNTSVMERRNFPSGGPFVYTKKTIRKPRRIKAMILERKKN